MDLHGAWGTGIFLPWSATEAAFMLLHPILADFLSPTPPPALRRRMTSGSKVMFSTAQPFNYVSLHHPLKPHQGSEPLNSKRGVWEEKHRSKQWQSVQSKEEELDVEGENRGGIQEVEVMHC